MKKKPTPKPDYAAIWMMEHELLDPPYSDHRVSLGGPGIACPICTESGVKELLDLMSNRDHRRRRTNSRWPR